MNPHLFYYDSLAVFKHEYFKDLITADHMISGEIFIGSLSYPDGGKDESANFWGYTFEKDGIKYLVSSKRKNRDTQIIENINIKDILPFKPSDIQKVAYKAQVYYLVNKPITARFKSEKKMGFRELVDCFCTLGHTNPKHRKLMIFLAMASMLDRMYFRLSSPPSTGKDNIVDTFGALVGGCSAITQPTLAKLEFRTTYKWLVVNEVVDIGKSEWRLIEQFLLDAAAHKPSIEKHSRAQDKNKEMMDISSFSLSLFYNDITMYPEADKYIDVVTKKAVLDRFPAFRVYGRFTEDFNSIRAVDVKKLVTDNMSKYKDIIYTFTYYKNNLNKELHYFKLDKLRKNDNSRWLTSMGRLLKIVDLYCDTQEEFDEWVHVINESTKDYEAMIEYPDLLKKSRCSDYDSLYKEDSFIIKNKMLRGENGIKENKNFW